MPQFWFWRAGDGGGFDFENRSVKLIKMERYRLTDHAKKRMAERGISIDNIELTFRHPDIIQSSFGKRKIFIKFIRNKRLEVVTVHKGNQIMVVTLYYAH